MVEKPDAEKDQDMGGQETPEGAEAAEEAVAAEDDADAAGADEQAAEGAEAELSPEDEVTKLRAEAAEMKDRLIRAMAETENVRRRSEKGIADASSYAVASFARDILNVADNLRRALDTLPEDVADDLKSFIEGVDLTERELLNTLEKHGVKKVAPEVGEKFDHHAHQAMFEVPTDEAPNGSIMQVVSVGYRLKERLLRPAMVGVAKGGAPKVDTEA